MTLLLQLGRALCCWNLDFQNQLWAILSECFKATATFWRPQPALYIELVMMLSFLVRELPHQVRDGIGMDAEKLPYRSAARDETPSMTSSSATSNRESIFNDTIHMYSC